MKRQCESVTELQVFLGTRAFSTGFSPLFPAHNRNHAAAPEPGRSCSPAATQQTPSHTSGAPITEASSEAAQNKNN